ncbi:calcineurin-binding protein cabin-1-like isoform X2 [Periplaneta americana]|uniref:calcineurin-binding protein cabin-1-like isoform X2 n=1 Tax=Periplaneta americana TaxID=6978 RepID=UPI0037E7A961
MIKLRALNEESSEESEGEEDVPTVTREAQEQTAFAQYNDALVMLRDKNFEGARTIFQDLLENSFLVEVTKQEGTEGLGHPALVLKYSCLKNMGTIYEKQGELQGALKSFLQAAELDGSDVTLWYRIGTVAVQVVDYELACDAFLEGLRCSPRHWPCLDNLVTILYVLNDYIPCLLYIARAFELDPDFLKGLAFRDKILLEQPSIMDDFNVYCKGHDLGQLNAEYDTDTGKELISEALEMREKRRKLSSEVFAPKPLETVTLSQPLTEKTWVSLGETLVQLHQHIKTKESIRHFCYPVDLKAVVGVVKEAEKDTKPSAEPMAVDQPANDNAGMGGNEEAAPLVAVEEDGAGDAAGTGESEEARSRKRRRSSLCFLEQWMWGGKRRSARVRSTVKREAEREDFNVEEVLRRLIPQSLLPNVMKDEKRKELEAMKSTEDSLDTMDLYKLFERRESTEGRSDDNQRSTAASPNREKEDLSKVINDETYFGTEKETIDIEKFIQLNNKHDIIDLLIVYVKSICNKWQILWPEALPAVFLQAYQCMRQHVNHPSVFSSEEDEDWIKEDACITLLYGELFVDRWLQDKITTDFKIGYEDEIPAESIGQLVFVSVREGLFKEEHLKYILRLYWLKAHLFINQGSADIAIESLHTILQYLEERCDATNMQKVFLPNCKHHNIINKELTQKLLITLKRNQNLYKVQNLYDEQHYEDLVEILQETFHFSQQSQLPLSTPNNSTSSCPDRATQLAMLMDALWQLKRYQDCFYWGEACCNEALHKYLNSEDKEQSKWASTVEKLLSGMESCVNKGGISIIDSMPNSRLARLVQNLTHTVCHQLEAPETAVEMPVETISPWILLQQILQHKEEKGKSRSNSEDDEEHEASEIGELPGYISILFTAHEYLGKRSWCCSGEGALLLHTMNVVIPRLRDERFISVRDKLNQGLEQVFYCLYAHPNKKTKARYLQDHGVPQISLTWERGMQLYQFYQPDELPEFDSYRVASITADVESLFKRIAGLIPDHCNPAHLVEKVVAYIDGTSRSLPVLGDARSQLPRSISAIYYLLADYYFKVNEWGKAIRHYLLDVCVNPIRIDSWAGMALARGSQLETKLNSCEPLKSEMDFLRQASAAQRCFQRALDIESNHSLMWIEYGSFVYMVHSFCSRLLKQETDCLSLEMFEKLENQKEKMLDIAVKCFTTASKIWYAAGEDSGIQDERWLHQYMLGKVAEKRDHDPSVYLTHFTKASELLHENRASYARKISYNNPQNLAVEALEVYYRIHACILKYLEQYEGKKLEKDMRILFEKLLKEATEGPFMASNAKEVEGKAESDEERKKRPVESFDDVFEEIGFTKKARLDLPLDICVMRDVIDVMEEIITKVVESENARLQSLPPVQSSEIVKEKVVNSNTIKDDDVETIILDDSLPQVFQSADRADPPNLNIENVIKKEIEECQDMETEEGAIEKLDAIDLAMEVVEEVVVVVEEGNDDCDGNGNGGNDDEDNDDDENENDDDLEQTDIKENINKEESEKEVSEFKKLQGSNIITNTVSTTPKVGNEDKHSQLVESKEVASGENKGNVDGEEEDDDDDEDDDDEDNNGSDDNYDGDDDDDEEEVKDDKKDFSSSKSDVKKELPEQPPEREGIMPEVSINRRSSQESTTTTTTTTTTETSTANSSSSSSDSEGDSSSSNEDSSNSSSSSDSDNSSDSNSDDADDTIVRSTPSGKKKEKDGLIAKEGSTKGSDDKEKTEGIGEEEEEEEDGNQDHYELIRRCLVALEECVLRFPQHYKSLYRLTHFYFHSKFHRNVSKCQDLLLGTYKCLPLDGRSQDASFQGLFAERKNNNFFNGVWRIPVSEIDRPGSFASHMSRCVLLLMEVLREVRDHRMLLELCIQLKRTPEADKKYLRDSEREQLCRQALTLSLQALRVKLREGPISTSLVMEMFRTYRRVQKCLPQKESTFASLLCDAYKQHAKMETAVLEQAISFCQQEIIASRAAAHPPVTTSTPVTSSQPVTTVPTVITAATTATTVTTTATTTTTAAAVITAAATAIVPTTTSTVVITQQQRKIITSTTKPIIVSAPPAIQLPSRSRGRPPNVSRVSTNVTPVNSKSQPASSRNIAQTVTSQQLGSIIPPNLSTLPFYPYTFFTDPSILNAAVQSKLPSMMDQVAALNFLNQHAHVGGYQAEFLRHFAASTGSMFTPMMPNVPTSQSQKSLGGGGGRPSSSSFGSNKILGLPNSLSQQKISTSLPASISITPLPPSQTTAPCNTSTATTSSTKYSSKNAKSTPSLQQKLQASQALAKSTSNRSSALNLSPSGKSSSVNQPPVFSKSVSQKPSTAALLSTTASYTLPKDQTLYSHHSSKSSTNPSGNPYTSLIKGGEGMLTPGVSITQVMPTPVNTTISPKPSTAKLLSFRKQSVPPLQGNRNQDQSNTPRDATNLGSLVSGSSVGSSTNKSPESSKGTNTLVSRSQPSGSASGQPGKSHVIASNISGPRNQNSGIAPESSMYKGIQDTPKSSHPSAPRGQISEPKGSGTSLIKSKSPESKDSSPPGIYKNQTGNKGSRSPAQASSSLRSIGHEITVTPSLSQSTSTTASSISMLSRLQQQSTELEIITKPKPSTLDLSVTIPSSITITPKQQNAPDGNFRGQQGRQSPAGSGTKKYKDSVSITEIGRKVPSGSQGAKRMGGPVAIRQDKQRQERQDDKHGSGSAGDVEIITLE